MSGQKPFFTKEESDIWARVYAARMSRNGARNESARVVADQAVFDYRKSVKSIGHDAGGAAPVSGYRSDNTGTM